MPHRDVEAALRARIATLEEENEALRAELAAVRHEAEAEPEVDQRTTATEIARLGARAAAAERARREAEAKIVTLERTLAVRQYGPASARPSEASERRLASAEAFAREGRGREALQIVLSVSRGDDPPARAASLLRTRVYCVKDRVAIEPPPPGTPEADAFRRGRCPRCQTFLELTRE